MRNTFEVPARIEEFRRSPDLPRRGESKAQSSLMNPWLKLEIATRVFGEKRSGDGRKREVGLGHPAGSPIYTLGARAG